MTGLARAAALTVAAILVMAGAWYGVTQWQRATADYRGETQLIEDTSANADFRRTAYESFFDRCASVQTKEQTIRQQEAEREGASDARAAQIDTNIAALEASRAAQINQYNAAARMDWTSGPFLDAGLPYQLDIDERETTCTD